MRQNVKKYEKCMQHSKAHNLWTSVQSDSFIIGLISKNNLLMYACTRQRTTLLAIHSPLKQNTLPYLQPGVSEICFIKGEHYSRQSQSDHLYRNKQRHTKHLQTKCEDNRHFQTKNRQAKSFTKPYCCKRFRNIYWAYSTSYSIRCNT